VIIVDEALRRRAATGTPIQIGLIGAGAMGRGIALQIQTAMPGMRLAVIGNRTLEHARQAYRAAGTGDVATVTDETGLARAIEAGIPAITDDSELVCTAPGLDVVLEATGAVEFGARIALATIAAGRHLVTMNAELQGTLGPILKRKADAAGVVLSDCDGDQPGVMMNLYRFVSGLGVRPVVVGNMKGLHDPYRNPTTQADFARRNHLTPHMAASFADGTKMSFEMALIANATGLQAGVRGLYGPSCARVHDAERLFAERFSVEALCEKPLIDYIVGAEPAPGVFILGHHPDPEQRRWLALYKLGAGPLYTFYTPYHLCHLEAPWTLARAVLFRDAAIAPEAGHVVDVVATAKRALVPGEVLDGIGWYATYGQCENAAVTRAEGLLPMGLAKDCRVRRAVAKDQVLTYDDVELPEGRLIDRLRAEQTVAFPGA
jgi:predicted homoserine dehydrogenase-like protein